MLSVKGGGDAQTTRMLAQKQPPFKECVTAHKSSISAPKIHRGSSIVPKQRILELSKVVEERPAGGEAAPGGAVDRAGASMPA